MDRPHRPRLMLWGLGQQGRLLPAAALKFQEPHALRQVLQGLQPPPLLRLTAPPCRHGSPTRGAAALDVRPRWAGQALQILQRRTPLQATATPRWRGSSSRGATPQLCRLCLPEALRAQQARPCGGRAHRRTALLRP